MEVPHKIKIQLPDDPTIPLYIYIYIYISIYIDIYIGRYIYIYPKGMKSLGQRDICTPMFSEAHSQNCQKWKQYRSASTDEWIKEM
jgi:hypothetical protein